jgi:hypothetical protein
MPFAAKFRAMMDFPFAGETLDGFIVERIEVRDVPGMGRYVYAVEMVLHGPGGEAGVRRAIRSLFAAHPLTFSGYGNPYQLWSGRPEIERLGDGRYAVRAKGSGARIYIEDELARFLAHLGECGLLAQEPDESTGQEMVSAYLADYQAEIKRQVERYRRKLRREEDAASFR